jgi:hypothetical protein
VKCELSPVNEVAVGKYRITLATDIGTAPSVMTATKGVTLYRLDQFAASQPFLDSVLARENLLKTVTVSTLTLVYAFFIFFGLRKLRFVLSGISKPMVVGKILGPMGNPIQGAEVELELTSPPANYEPTVTDSQGDFIFGRAKKISFFAGRMRVAHSSYESAVFAVSTPILVETLRPKVKAQGQPE